jgi:hypothetical protein
MLADAYRAGGDDRVEVAGQRQDAQRRAAGLATCRALASLMNDNVDRQQLQSRETTI